MGNVSYKEALSNALNVSLSLKVLIKPFKKNIHVAKGNLTNQKN